MREKLAGAAGVSARRDRIRRRVVFVLLVIGALLVFFPFYWALVGSLKTKDEFWAFPPTLWPQSVMWSNYAEALTIKIPTYMWNSTFVSAAIVLWQVFSSCLAAYVFVRFKFKLKTALFNLLMLLYMLPAAVTHIPGYIILANMNLLDTYLGLIISNCASVFAIFMLRQYFLQIDNGLYDAAEVDGAGDLRTLFQIMVPLSKPALIVICLNGFISNYNNYVWPSLITRSPERFLVSQGLRRFFVQESAYGIKFPQMMAASVVVMLPLLILFAFTQRWFESGIADSGSKG